MNKHDISHFRTILLIDTTQRELTNLALLIDGQATTLTRPVRAQELQQLIAELLSQHQLAVDQIEAVAVLIGPGSFTGTRIGATAANTLHWLTRAPVIVIDGDNFEQAVQTLKDGRQLSVTDRAIPKY